MRNGPPGAWRPGPLRHVVRVQVRVEGPNDGRERVSALALSRVSSNLKLSSGELTLSRMLELEILVV
jgi:hypothetical protein